MTKQIKKAVFPVAGMGTRFLPATKANPKEMLPIVDKPLIQYAVEEAIAAGIKELIFVTSGSKHSIENHFDSNFSLEYKLKQQGKDDLLRLVRDVLPDDVSCVYVRQKETLGLGDAINCAKSVVDHEPFAVLLADDLFEGQAKNTLTEMIQLYNENQAGVIAVEEVENTERYGIISGDRLNDNVLSINNIVEKPAPEHAPSNLGVAGRYVLPPEIFDYLDDVPQGHGGEIQLTDAIAALLADQKMFAYRFSGQRYDCGSKLGYLQATIAVALKHHEVATEFKDYLLKMDIEKG